MKLFTTLVLLILLGAGLLVWFTGAQLPPGWLPGMAVSVPPSANEELRLLPSLRLADLRKLTVRRGGETLVELQQSKPNLWTVCGNWPASPQEVQATLSQLEDLRSRFTPLHTDSETLRETGLDKPALELELVTADDKTHRVLLGEAPGEYRFVRPTFARVDKEPRILRLQPGLVQRLGKPAESYRQRRIFPSERVARLNNPQERIDRLDAREITLTAPDSPRVRLVRGPEGWELAEPTRDRLDPDAAERLLAAAADLWAEQFITDKKVSTGLESPERKIVVTRNDGSQVALSIGARSRSEAPPPPSLLGNPPPALPDSYRYARLDGSPLVFEVQDGKFNDLFLDWKSLRDSRLARFKTDDAERIEIRQGGTVAVLQRQGKDSWQMLQPRDTPADNDRIRDLLTKISTLESTDRDLLGEGRRAALVAAVPATLGRPTLANLSLAAALSFADKGLGLERPEAEIILSLREKARPEDRDRSKSRTIALRISRGGPNRTLLQAQGWPRIDAADGSVLELLERPTLAYRSKRPVDFTADQVQQLEIRQIEPSGLAAAVGLVGRLDAVAAAALSTNTLILDRQGGDWRLLRPLNTLADSARANELADALGRLQVQSYITDKVSAEQLAEYGLTTPIVQVLWTLSDSSKPVGTLSIGRTATSSYYARLNDTSDVFTIPADLVPQLSRSALAYLPASLWQIALDDDIDRFRIRRPGQADYEIVRAGEGWQVTGPFTVAAPSNVVEQLRNVLQAPRAEEYRSASDSNLETYGLDRPAIQVSAITRKGQEHTLWLGKVTGDKGTRFARLPSRPGVFVVNEILVRAVDQSPLDFLDRTLLRFDSAQATGILRNLAKQTLQLVRTDEKWQFAQPDKSEADELKVPQFVRLLSDLQAERLVAYQPKDLSPFGLDAPEARWTISFEGQPPRILLVGKKAEGEGRYATVEGSQVVGILNPRVTQQLLAAPLAFRDHQLARVPDVDLMKLTQGSRVVSFSRPEGTWKVTDPLQADADHEGLESFFNALSRFRADQLVAEKPTPEMLGQYGLDRPVARWQLFHFDEEKLDLTIGNKEKDGPRRYARLAGRDLVFLLDEKTSRQATTEYRPRTVFKQPIDPAQIESVRFAFRDNPFEIRKNGNDWAVVGKPDTRLDTAQVNDVLAVLRDLKLERYVRDTKADAKLFGLDPAELVLEVSTPTAKVTLQLGGLEGDSKRRYARLPGSDAVFVLDEMTSSKLFSLKK